MRKFLAMSIMLAFFYGLAVVLWKATGSVFYLLNFSIIGTSIGLGMGLWPVLPRGKKYIARLISQLLVGGYLFSGAFMASVIHYMVAKIFGPRSFREKGGKARRQD